MQKLSILGKESIHCGFHLVPYIVHTLLSTLPTSTFALITDWNVSHLHLRAFRDEFATQLEKSGSSSRFVDLAIAPGETSKSRDGKAHVEDWLLSNKCTRDTVILALGGGVIGDLVGFVAATLCVFPLSAGRIHLEICLLVCEGYDLSRSPPPCWRWSILV